MDFTTYIDAFNSGDYVNLVDQWFTEDVVWEDGGQTVTGRDEWLNLFHFIRNGIREIFRPITGFDGPSGHFREIDMDFHALKSRPDFPFGPLAPGDMMTVKFFIIYECEGNRIRRLKAATWPVNYGTSKLPRLGAHVTQRAAFQAFQAALAHEHGANARQYLAAQLQMGSTGGTRSSSHEDAIGSLREAGVATATLKDARDDELLLDAGGRLMRLGLQNGLISQFELV